MVSEASLMRKTRWAQMSEQIIDGLEDWRGCGAIIIWACLLLEKFRCGGSRGGEVRGNVTMRTQEADAQKSAGLSSTCLTGEQRRSVVAWDSCWQFASPQKKKERVDDRRGDRTAAGGGWANCLQYRDLVPGRYAAVLIHSRRGRPGVSCCCMFLHLGICCVCSI